MPTLNETMESAEQVGTTLSSLVPQLFFDLIARIIPGLVIIWSLYLALLGNKLLNSQDLLTSISPILPKNEFFVFCIAIIVFYNCSILFYGIWAVIVRLWTVILHRGNMINSSETIFVEVIDSSPEFSFRQDFIKLNAPIAGNRITKLKAEIHMSGSLTATYFLCFLVSIVFWSWSELEPIELIFRIMFFWLGFIGFLFSNFHFSSRLYRSVNSYSILLGFESRYPTL